MKITCAILHSYVKPPEGTYLIDLSHGSLNVTTEHHPTMRYLIYNCHSKVMSNSPKMGHLPIPASWTTCGAYSGIGVGELATCVYENVRQLRSVDADPLISLKFIGHWSPVSYPVVFAMAQLISQKEATWYMIFPNLITLHDVLTLYFHPISSYWC